MANHLIRVGRLTSYVDAPLPITRDLQRLSKMFKGSSLLSVIINDCMGLPMDSSTTGHGTRVRILEVKN